MDVDNMSLIIERRDAMIAEKNTAFNKQPTDGVSLLTPKPVKKGMGKQTKISWGMFVINLILACVPAIIVYIGMSRHSNAIVCLIQLSVVYAIVIAVHFYFLDPMVWRALNAVDLRSSMLKINFYFALPLVSAALVSSLVMIVFCAYFTVGPREIRLNLPDGNIIIKQIWWILFYAFHALVLPVGETLFYFFVVLSSYHHTLFMTVILAGCYSAMHFAYLAFSVSGFGWVIFATIVMMALGWVMIVAVRRETIIKALAMRMGVGIGFVLFILFLNVAYPAHTASPEQYLPYRESSD